MELTIGDIYDKLHNLGYSSEETLFGCDLIKSYIKQETSLSDNKVNKIFSYCWEQGHAYGVYEVFSYAIELCDLLQEVLDNAKD